MTWAAVTTECHVSVTTIKGMTFRSTLEVDGVMIILQWLGRRLDDFIVRSSTPSERTHQGDNQPPIPQLYARFDTIALHAALNRKRAEHGLSWSQVAGQLGLSVGSIARFTRGGRTSTGTLIPALEWLQQPAETFMQPSQSTVGPARMDRRAREVRDGPAQRG